MSDEIELDQHSAAGRNVSALLSAALAAAQTAAQASAVRARDQAQTADEQARHAQQLTRDQEREQTRVEAARAVAQRQLERQQRAEQAVRHRQWSVRPSSTWLHDNPLSAASAWASADVHRHDDPAAARHAEQWETVFAREGIDLSDVRANAPAALQQDGVAAGPSSQHREPAEVAGELAAEVAADAVIAGTADAAAAAATAVGSSQWTAYADGAPAAALGGRGVSTPPAHVLSKVRQSPDPPAAAPKGAGRAAELAHSGELER